MKTLWTTVGRRISRHFYNKCDICHDAVVVNRKEATDKIALSGRLSKEIAKMIAKAEPQKYRLLQVADFVCLMELLKIKRNENRL